ncbi:hypothetical protein MMC06_006870, partial [Schaereria dolodes]|nr:hypothetical protein [Schaereria dolodes]
MEILLESLTEVLVSEIDWVTMEAEAERKGLRAWFEWLSTALGNGWEKPVKQWDSGKETKPDDF